MGVMGKAALEELRQLERKTRRWTWFNVFLLLWNSVWGWHTWATRTPEHWWGDRIFTSLFILCGGYAAWAVIHGISIVREIQEEQKRWE